MIDGRFATRLAEVAARSSLPDAETGIRLTALWPRRPETNDQRRETDDCQIRWKFFSISRRVMRRTTGRPCGQTLEYAVRRSSSRMYRIFSIVSG